MNKYIAIAAGVSKAVQSKDSLLLNSPTTVAVLETQIAKLPRDLRLANNNSSSLR